MKKLIVALLLIAASACAQQTNFYVGVSEYVGVQQTPVAYGGGAPAGWSPTNSYPTNIALWYDPVLSETNGGTLFFHDRVAGLYLTNTTGASFPTYTASGLNSLPIFTFDGVNDILRSAAAYPTTAEPFAWLMVFRWEATGTAEGRVTSFSDSKGIFRATATSNDKYAFAATGTGYPMTNIYNQWLIATIVHNGSDQIAFYTNFVREWYGSVASSEPTPATDVGLGGRFSDGGFAANFSIADWLVVSNMTQSPLDAAITNNVLSNCVWYLTNKYDLSP